VDKIVAVGERGAEIFKAGYPEDYRKHFERTPERGVPLMWPWHDQMYLGAIHGSCGILTVLLQCPSHTVHLHIPRFLATIDFLIDLATQQHGHLPSSIPVKRRGDPHVQLCHGSPGLLLLLATLQATFPEEFNTLHAAHYGVTTQLVQAVWERGLVQKGLGICHGVTGNAWTMLLLSFSSPRGLASDDLLSRALSFLLHATELPPLSQDPTPYRTPDHPYSLFEGLAGAVCAWADACAVIESRLHSKWNPLVLGMPGLGGIGSVPIM